MKRETADLAQIREKFNHNFKTGKIEFRSFHDLLWQIAINGMLDDEKEPVIFHLDVTGENGNELVLAFQSGGFKRTGVFFIEGDYNKCSDVLEEINEMFFEFNRDTQMSIIGKSMKF